MRARDRTGTTRYSAHPTGVWRKAWCGEGLEMLAARGPLQEPSEAWVSTGLWGQGEGPVRVISKVASIGLDRRMMEEAVQDGTEA